MNRTTATPLVGKLDWISVSLVLFLVVFGWLNILATVTPVADSFQWSWDHEAGKQLSFIGLASFLVLMVLLADAQRRRAAASGSFNSLMINTSDSS